MAAFDEPKSWIALIVGIIAAALGAIPLLSTWNIIGFTLPEFVLKLLDTIAIWVIAGIALLMFIDAIWEDDGIKTITIILALIFLAAGVIQILSNFGVIGFGIGFLKGMVAQILLVIEGFFLIIAAFAMD